VSLLAALTRAELDELIRTAEHAEHLAHIALANAPLDFVTPLARAGVAADVLALQMMAYDESIARMLAGEIP
jgi:hypothetical protein